MGNSSSFPTILIAEWDCRVRAALVETLKQNGYLVLDAEDSSHALDIAKIHSRPIQLMLVEGSPEGRTLAATLQMYRPKMQVVFTNISTDCLPDAPPVEMTLTRVRELLHPPMSRAAHA